MTRQSSRATPAVHGAVCQQAINQGSGTPGHKNVIPLIDCHLIVKHAVDLKKAKKKKNTPMSSSSDTVYSVDFAH